MKKQFDFVGKRVILFSVSAVLIVACALLALVRGFNVGQDFTGGTQMTFVLRSLDNNDEKVNVDDGVKDTVDGILEANGIKGGRLTTGEDGELIVNTSELTADAQLAVKEAIGEKYYVSDDEYSYESISGSVSRDLRDKAILGVTIAVALMLVYITVRFDWRSGVAAVVCLIHDVIIMFGAYSAFGIALDSNMIAAVLTILGYSINATIIVFDRIRENVRQNSKATFAENANKAINETVTRSLNTTLTTLFTIGMIFVLGPTSIKAFALPIIVGVVAGLYSSVCLSTNIWVLLKGKKAFEKDE